MTSVFIFEGSTLGIDRPFLMIIIALFLALMRLLRGSVNDELRLNTRWGCTHVFRR
jgi:hypothetical protein